MNSLLSRLLVLVISVPLCALPARRTCGELLSSSAVIASKIASIHQLKGTFEGLLPPHSSSIAAQFPEEYERVMRLFRDRPSHLIGINNGLPPQPGMKFGQIIRNIHQFADGIGKDLGYIFDDLPPHFYARELLRGYVTRFRAPINRWANRIDPFEPNNNSQLADLTRFGKQTVCSLWAELRITLLLEHVSRANATVLDLIKEGVVSNSNQALEKYLDQEIDHFWFPSDANGPYAVAIGETKVFDNPFDKDYSNRKRVVDQFTRYLEVASIIGAELGLPAQIHYFFVAGISQNEIARLENETERFNERLTAAADERVRSQVKLFVSGDYGNK